MIIDDYSAAQFKIAFPYLVDWIVSRHSSTKDIYNVTSKCGIVITYQRSESAIRIKYNEQLAVLIWSDGDAMKGIPFGDVDLIDYERYNGSIWG